MVSLMPRNDGAASAEILFALHPEVWGRGLATSMSRAVMSQAFQCEGCESILAGADAPNGRSFAVMDRLGMKFLRHVEYPAGQGAEYLVTHAEFSKLDPVESIEIVEG